MAQKNQNEKTTSNFIEVNGTGTIATTKGPRDIFVYGYFTKWNRWSFIVHQDIMNPCLFNISEASTGYRLMDGGYSSVEDALRSVLPFIEEKHYYFATAVNHALVKTQTNLLKRNTTNLQTLAIDTALWM